MVGFVEEIHRRRIYKILHALDVYILEHLLAIHLGKTTIENSYRHALATISLLVETDAAQGLHLRMSLAVDDICHGIPRVETVAIFP